MILKIQKIFEILENRGLVFWMPAGIILIGLLGALDSLTGNEIDFSFFYLAPIVLVTWSVGQRTGLLMSALSAFIMLGAESAAGQKYSQPDIYVLNTLIRAGFFMVVTYLVAELHKSHREERLAARTDFVTGAFNARYFTELLQM